VHEKPQVTQVLPLNLNPFEHEQLPLAKAAFDTHAEQTPLLQVEQSESHDVVVDEQTPAVLSENPVLQAQVFPLGAAFESLQTKQAASLH
jgi:hypothetical protein